ncbi:MAG: hypothetical protein R2939_12600 [Kofleriaceae bacterium]
MQTAGLDAGDGAGLTVAAVATRRDRDVGGAAAVEQAHAEPRGRMLPSALQ